MAKRGALEDRGYRVLTVGHDLESTVRARPDIFDELESGDGDRGPVAQVAP